jgi:MFS superfamily sulfate permease-like transporter
MIQEAAILSVVALMIYTNLTTNETLFKFFNNTIIKCLILVLIIVCAYKFDILLAVVLSLFLIMVITLHETRLVKIVKERVSYEPTFTKPLVPTKEVNKETFSQGPPPPLTKIAPQRDNPVDALIPDREIEIDYETSVSDYTKNLSAKNGF